jgi:hypothetical protein
MSDSHRADYGKLMRGYYDTFRVLGRSKVCKLHFDSGHRFPLQRAEVLVAKT